MESALPAFTQVWTLNRTISRYHIPKLTARGDLARQIRNFEERAKSSLIQLRVQLSHCLDTVMRAVAVLASLNLNLGQLEKRATLAYLLACSPIRP